MAAYRRTNKERRVVRLMTAGACRSRLNGLARQRRELEKKLDRVTTLETRYAAELRRLDQIEFEFGEDRIYA